MTDDLIRKDTTELASLISSRQVSPVELTEACLRRIDALNPTLNAFLTVCGDEAMESAREAEKSAGPDMPPLHGIPVAVKDLEATKGIRTTFGSLAFKDNVPDEDSIIVERLRKAGAIVLGKTNTPEFGQSTSTENRLGDDCRNPWDTGRTSGGSSGGSGAALAAYICPWPREATAEARSGCPPHSAGCTGSSRHTAACRRRTAVGRCFRTAGRLAGA